MFLFQFFFIEKKKNVKLLSRDESMEFAKNQLKKSDFNTSISNDHKLQNLA